MEYAYISRLVKVHVVYFLIVVLVWSMEYPKKGVWRMEYVEIRSILSKIRSWVCSMEYLQKGVWRMEYVRIISIFPQKN